MADPQVTLLGLLAIPLLHLGLVEQARARLQQAHARARQLGQPMARMVAIWYDALFEVRLGNAERVAALADEMHALVDEFALAQGRNGEPLVSRLGGRPNGRAARGLSPDSRGLRRKHAARDARGTAARPWGMPPRRCCSRATGTRRNEQLEEALQFANKHAERVYLPQLFLIEAAIARARGDSAAAHASVRQALAEARAQEAPWLELIALIELCESRRRKGRRPARACRTRRSASRSGRYRCSVQSAGAARRDEGLLNAGPGGGPRPGAGRPPEGLTGVEGIAGNDLGP